jgi:hypothetical protein
MHNQFIYDLARVHRTYLLYLQPTLLPGRQQTGASGVFLFANLTAAYTYSVDAFSPNHTSSTRTVTITGASVTAPPCRVRIR